MVVALPITNCMSFKSTPNLEDTPVIFIPAFDILFTGLSLIDIFVTTPAKQLFSCIVRISLNDSTLMHRILSSTGLSMVASSLPGPEKTILSGKKPAAFANSSSHIEETSTPKPLCCIIFNISILGFALAE